MKKLIFLIAFVFFSGLACSKPTYDPRTYIPEKAYQYLPMIKDESKRLFPELRNSHYFAGLTEQESCISLTNSRCFSPTAELKTKHEHGVGFGQITRAYKDDCLDPSGSCPTRFDLLTELKQRHPTELSDVTWENIKTKPAAQIKMMMFTFRSCYFSPGLVTVQDEIDRLSLCDAAYNGGLGGLNKERLACGLSKNCNPKIWFENVEKHCLKSKKPLYGNRSACDINREHPRNIFKIRMEKYKPYF